MDGILSSGGGPIVFWLGVVFFGRWIGFAKGYDFAVPEGIDFDFTGFLYSYDAPGWC